MTPRGAGHERVYRWLLRLYPAAFRVRFADEMVQLFGDQLRDARTGGAPVGALRTWLGTLGDLAVTAASEHTRRDRTVAHSLTASPSISSRALGGAGILGGAALLAAFLVEIPEGLNIFRLVLFNLGAIAIVVVVHRRQAAAAPKLALMAAVPALLANAWYLAWIVFAGEFGLIGFFAGVAMWLTDAAFGLVTLRLGMVTRWGALALAIGSVLAIAGIDRLGLTSPQDPTIFGSLALVGAALNGIGWILLGLAVATRRRASEAQPPRARLRD
ncbi:MAG: hypothetical protein ABI841_02235 [Chloroflexota bacterium]